MRALGVFLLAAAALAAAAEEQIEPEFVRPLVPVERGRNDSNPVWSPSGDMIAFERSRGDDREIVVVRADGAPVQTIRHQNAAASGKSQFFFPAWSSRRATTPASAGRRTASASCS